MRKMLLVAGALSAFVGGAVSAQSANWLLEAIYVRSFQTQIMRHPSKSDLYYLCWTDGVERSGFKFSRRNFNRSLRSVEPGVRIHLSDLFMSQAGGDAWSATDDRVCWGRA